MLNKDENYINIENVDYKIKWMVMYKIAGNEDIIRELEDLNKMDKRRYIK